MKRILSVFLALAMIIAVTSTAFAAEITAQTPLTDENGVYQIGTAEELYGFAELVNGGKTSANAVLTADIVVNENVLDESGELNSGDFASWTPIGNYNVQYAGTFDGQGHTISGLYYNDSNGYVGLFGYIGSGGNISNVGVVDSYICGAGDFGGVCGYNKGAITDCYSARTVINGEGALNVGGVCAENAGTIIGCYNTGTVCGDSYIGGVCGTNTGTITDCYNTGTVIATYSNVGGVCGTNYGTITKCYNTGGVSASYSETREGYMAGGVCGCNNGKVIACYNTGTVDDARSDVGGVCGDNDSDGIIIGCFSTGEAEAMKRNSGGVCGDNYGTITGCYAKSGEAVCGSDTGTVTDCAIYSNSVFSSGTVLNLLNTALSNAGYDIQFYQMSTESYPVLIDNSIVTSYTVTIPEAIKIGEAVTVSATEVTLKKAEKLTVAITETSEEDNTFKLRTTDGAELAYTVKNGDNNITINDAILILGYTDNQGEATLNFVPTESAKFSGSYSGTVTFTVSVG